ncbi:MAG: rhodanese-like domain-containing protein [Bacteroidetes bacterium]|nr:rhodanese-like domain-containing protein [Bacteroidota bacterium]
MNITIIDVRTPGEYAQGHVKNSINVPLQELHDRIDELQQISGRIVLCCASGIRSAKACKVLQQNGFTNVSDGGSWIDVGAVLLIN